MGKALPTSEYRRILRVERCVETSILARVAVVKKREAASRKLAADRRKRAAARKKREAGRRRERAAKKWEKARQEKERDTKNKERDTKHLHQRKISAKKASKAKKARQARAKYGYRMTKNAMALKVFATLTADEIADYSTKIGILGELLKKMMVKSKKS